MRHTKRMGRVLRGAALVVASASVAGTSCGPAWTGDEGAARVIVARPAVASTVLSSMVLTVAPGNVAGQPSFSPFQIDLPAASPWVTHASGIPAGLGRVLTLQARDAGVPPADYVGSAVVDVAAGGTVEVAIPLQQAVPRAAAANAAPVFDTLSIDAVSAPIGSTLALGATAHDPDPADVVGYAWSVPAGCGTFLDSGRSTTARPSTFWIAPFTPGTCRLTLVVGDGRGATVSVYVDVAVTP